MDLGFFGIFQEKIFLSQLMYSGTRNCLIISGAPSHEERGSQTKGTEPEAQFKTVFEVSGFNPVSGSLKLLG